MSERRLPRFPPLIIEPFLSPIVGRFLCRKLIGHGSIAVGFTTHKHLPLGIYRLGNRLRSNRCPGLIGGHPRGDFPEFLRIEFRLPIIVIKTVFFLLDISTLITCLATTAVAWSRLLLACDWLGPTRIVS